MRPIIGNSRMCRLGERNLVQRARPTRYCFSLETKSPQIRHLCIRSPYIIFFTSIFALQPREASLSIDLHACRYRNPCMGYRMVDLCYAPIVEETGELYGSLVAVPSAGMYRWHARRERCVWSRAGSAPFFESLLSPAWLLSSVSKLTMIPRRPGSPQLQAGGVYSSRERTRHGSTCMAQ